MYRRVFLQSERLIDQVDSRLKSMKARSYPIPVQASDQLNRNEGKEESTRAKQRAFGNQQVTPQV